MTTNTLDEATIARTIRSSVRVLGLYGTDAELLEAMPNSAACVRAGFALASRGGEREAAREALTKCAEMGDGYTTARVWFGDTSGGMASVSVGVIVREFRDREYPAPQDRAPTLMRCVDCGTMHDTLVECATPVEGAGEPDLVAAGVHAQDIGRNAYTRDENAIRNLARAYLNRADGVKVLAEEVARRAMVESQLRKEIDALRAAIDAALTGGDRDGK